MLVLKFNTEYSHTKTQEEYTVSKNTDQYKYRSVTTH